jgi:hypothetical protein
LLEANLGNTCLDPSNPIPTCDLSKFKKDGKYIIGYRTKYTMCSGNTIYESGNEYIAPYFSTCLKTDCQPGIYLSPTKKWIRDMYGSEINIITIKALKSETIKVFDKYRAKRIWVL